MIRIQVIKIGPIENNVFVVFDEETKNGVLIDCSDNSERILRVLSDLRVNIKYICLTHTHYDHILGLKGVMDGLKTGIVGGAKKGGFDLKRAPGIVIHKSEARYLLEGISNPRHFCDERMAHFEEKDLFIFEGGEMICMEGIEIEVIHTPGHTVG
ncbi:MBL fold metallo-hydrolase, partial [Patescibacteria group bacterium]|nr:MBL fold metallo-hydrolase [Patescibacteria group bacterium]